MNQAVIVGVGATEFSRTSELADEQLLAQAISAALNDAGMSKHDVEGLAVGTINLPDDAPHLAEHFGMEAGWVLKGDYGGASGLASMARARFAIEAGLIDSAVIVAGGNRTDFPHLQHDVTAPQYDYSLRNHVFPYGYGGPNGFFGLIQQRHMYEFGTKLEQLGKIATTFRANAMHNERALLTSEMSMQDYLESRLIADPIRKYDCVMRCCGAIAVVLANEKVAAGLTTKPVFMGAYGERASHQANTPSPNRLEMGFLAFRDRLFAETKRSELDFLQLYDDYPIAVLMMLENLGFTEMGTGGPFIESVDIGYSGDFPINTGGGQLSVGQPGTAGGMLHVLEAVEQLRGECGKRQVRNAQKGLVTGIGMLAYLGNLSMTNAMILGTDTFR